MVFAPELKKSEVLFGDLVITRIYDGRNKNPLPSWVVEISKGDELLSRIVGAGFDDFAISPGESIFVGISNGGYPDTAYLAIDKDGKLLLFKRHMLDMSLYCEFSVSSVREWYNGKSPDIQFKDATRLNNRDGPEWIFEFSVAGFGGERVTIKIR